jgi:hypothetical protein
MARRAKHPQKRFKQVNKLGICLFKFIGFKSKGLKTEDVRNILSAARILPAAMGNFPATV